MRESSLYCSVYVEKKKKEIVFLLTMNIADKNDELLGENMYKNSSRK